ncbi:hypothetical protein [Frigoriglobus tundricola]|uniref:hypothetical protein n=1 Tax=Frigoriglobus tundricola TaxID=2774151 RepID=UPI00148ED445|nr:hypothetical protein [Frigoriglobus tundricola]
MLDGVPDAACDAVRRWWAGLTLSNQRLVAELADEQREASFFGVAPGIASVPTVFGGRFLANDDAWRFGDWEADWREYLTEHPDIFLSAQFVSRCFRDGDGSVCILVDWSRTRFCGSELPPSAQRRAEPHAAPDPAA